ncbi:MAG: hypothetical protein ABW022_11005 [Actinoplanes sp.]
MSEPVGPQYGLNPRLDHTLTVPPVTSEDILTNPIPYDDPTATEFGGVAGRVQPSPHVPSGIERLHQIYMIDPTDPGDEPGSVAAPELDGNFNSRSK